MIVSFNGGYFVDCPIHVFEFMRAYRGQNLLEQRFVLGIGADNRVRGLVEIPSLSRSAGDLTLVEIFRSLLMCDADAGVVVTCRPSDELEFRPAERDFNHRLRHVADQVNCPILDHVIVGLTCCVADESVFCDEY